MRGAVRFEVKDYIKGAVFAFGLLFYYLTVSKDVEIRIVKLEAASANQQKVLEEIRADVKTLINNKMVR